MYQKILTPLDGSELAEKAIQHAIEAAQHWQAELHLLRVVVPRPPFYLVGPTAVPLPQWVDEAIGEQKKACQAYLESLQSEWARKGQRVVGHVVTAASPEAGILDFIAKQSVDLVVMSSHGRSGLRRLMLGSVAQGVLRGSKATVTLVRGGEEAEQQPKKVEPKPRQDYVYTTTAEWMEDFTARVGSVNHHDLRVSAPREFGGAEEWWSPEDLLVAAAEADFMHTFVKLARDRGINLLNYRSRAVGRVEGDGVTLRLGQIDIHPEVEVDSGQELLGPTLEEAERVCRAGHSLVAELKVHY